ncbi:MAG TPA: hypothetical protein ENK58_05825, partial [Desulfobacterales bacterium]|nr:hypothetical protein [Desulfobacterales bacterium]
MYSRYCSFPVGSVETIICPVITSITTEEVLPGETFTINGRDFNDVKNVKVGDEYVDFSVESSTRISATAGEKSGKVTVVTDKCEATSTQDIPVPGAGFIYYDIAGNEIDSGDQNLIEKNAVKRVDKRQRKTDYALEIGHDFSESGLSSGYMENFGNPNPEDGKHWIQSGEEVMIRVDTMVYEPTRDTRHITKGYILSLESSGTFKEQEKSFSGDLEDEREFTLTLDGPKKVFFLWKTEYSFQVMSMPAAMGDNLSPESGTYWYDIGEDVTSSAKDGCLKIEGYRDSISALIETVVADETTISGIPAQEKTYTIDRPVQITWQYEAHNYEETVIIGNSVTLSNVPKSVLDRADIKSEPVRPTSTDPSQAEQGAEELHYWSVSDKKLFPLIGGRTFQVEWKNKSGEKCEQKLITTIHTEWPDPPHYVHVAETPPVPLDPYGNDKFAFKSLKYSSNEAQVSPALEFTSSKAGKSTLLFTKVSSGVATGDMNAEPAYVRVVDTRTWTTDKETASAEIGKELTSEHHDKRDPYANASPHTGYLFHEHARYNVNVYDRATLQGQIFPVNRQFTPEINDDLVVIWYRFTDHIFWPWKPVHYECQWPGNTKRVVIASREGSECKGADGIYQTWPDRDGEEKNYLDPARYKDVMIYQQPDPTLPGYNPNEEHAVATASFRHGDMPSPPVAAFGLRDDLNITAQDETHTSENYVLLQYYDLKASNHEMEVFDIVKRDYANGYKFEYEMKAGDLLTAPYPLNKVIGAAPPSEICGRNGDPAKNCYWEDHKGQSWAVSGDAHLFAYFWYPLAPEFWYEKDHNGNDASEEPGDPIPWLPDGIVTSGSGFPTDMNGKARAVQVRYNTKWPEEVPVLKAGETVTFAGGEYRADHPQTRQGLPMVLGWAAGQVIFDDLNPKMEKGKVFDDYLVRLVQTLEERTVDLPVDDMPEELQPAAGRVTSVGGRWYFKELHTGLKTRVFYDPLMARKDPETGEVVSIGKLGILGFVNGKTLGDDDLTAS